MQFLVQHDIFGQQVSAYDQEILQSVFYLWCSIGMVYSSWNVVCFKICLDLEKYEFAWEVHSNHGQQKARKLYSRDENLYAKFVYLKSYVIGMMTHYQQYQAQEK